MPPRRVLIFGGTGEARDLANRLVDDGFHVVTALAGVTREPKLPGGAVHHGRLGGAPGIARFAAAEDIDVLVDATHPFATRISFNIAAAARDLNVPCWRLERPAWQPEQGDQWTEVLDFENAAWVPPTGARVFLTVGHRGVEPFFARKDISGVFRVIEPSGVGLPENWQVILSRPPHTLEDELSLMAHHRISALVTKNAGGHATQAKLLAARQMHIPVIMIRRPVKSPILTFDSPQDLHESLRQ